MSQRESEARDLWYLAQASALGIEIATNEPRIAANLLRKVRKSSLDPLLDSFVVRPSPLEPQAKIWIVRTIARNALLPPEASPLESSEHP